MNNLKFISSLFFITLSFNSFAADAGKSPTEKADAFYQSGDCEKAIPAYQAIPEAGLDQTLKDKILFKTSYCQFSLGHYADSEAGFKKYLGLHSNEDEARLKYSQSLLYQSKNKLAQEAATKITAADFKADAAIVIARAQIEEENFRGAIITLRPYGNNAEALYWAAVACYRGDYDAEAEQRFNSAMQKSNPDSWIQSESKAWLEKMKADKRKLHLRLTLGLYKDSNIDQSGSSGSVNQGEPGGPGPGAGQGGAGGAPGAGAPGTNKPTYGASNYTSDNGKYAAIDVIHNTYSSRKLSLTTTASASSTFYNDHEAYNQQIASLDLNLRAISSPTFNYGASLKYQDTFYNRVYSQDYIFFTPTTSWSFAPAFWLKFSIPVTSYLNDKDIKVYGGNLDLYYDPTNWLSVAVGVSKSKSTGPTAVIENVGNAPTLKSGTMFSHYNSTGAYVGLTFYAFDTYSFGTTYSKYTTKYDQDKMPGNQVFKSREDKLTSYQLSLNKTFIQNTLSGSLSYTHSDNKSDGFSGLPSNGYVSNYTYVRNYTMLSLEYFY